jgi:predicted thioredoxin/glutaredoxin
MRPFKVNMNYEINKKKILLKIRDFLKSKNELLYKKVWEEVRELQWLRHVLKDRESLKQYIEVSKFQEKYKDTATKSVNFDDFSDCDCVVV